MSQTALTSHGSPRDRQKAMFAAALERRMRAKGWQQSDLVRASGLSRDNISVYCRARSLPTPEKMAALARAFECSVDDLVPSLDESGAPSISFTQLANEPQWGHLLIDARVPFSIAADLMTLLSRAQDAVPAASGAGRAGSRRAQA